VVGGLCHFSPIYKHDGVGGIAPYPFLLYDRGEGRGHPTEDGSEHERPARPPRVEVHLTHTEVYYLGKLAYVHLRLLLKSGIKGCFWGVFFALF
jgi:hypothetical protein